MEIACTTSERIRVDEATGDIYYRPRGSVIVCKSIDNIRWKWLEACGRVRERNSAFQAGPIGRALFDNCEASWREIWHAATRGDMTLERAWWSLMATRAPHIVGFIETGESRMEFWPWGEGEKRDCLICRLSSELPEAGATRVFSRTGRSFLDRLFGRDIPPGERVDCPKYQFRFWIHLEPARLARYINPSVVVEPDYSWSLAPGNLLQINSL